MRNKKTIPNAFRIFDLTTTLVSWCSWGEASFSSGRVKSSNGFFSSSSKGEKSEKPSTNGGVVTGDAVCVTATFAFLCVNLYVPNPPNTRRSKTHVPIKTCFGVAMEDELSSYLRGTEFFKIELQRE